MDLAPSAAEGTGDEADPHGMGAAIEALSFGSRRTAHAPASVAVQRLLEGEQVRHALMGRHLGEDAIVILTDQRLVIANARRWNPGVAEVTNLSSVEVHGWADWRSAILQFVQGDFALIVDEISDVDQAKAMMETLRPGSSD